MPTATLQPDGSYSMEYEDGTTYARVPEEIARRDSPESFPDVGSDPYAMNPGMGMNPYAGSTQIPERPPWDQQARQEEMVFAESEVEPYTAGPGEMVFGEDEVEAYTPQPQQPQSQSHSRSASVSVRRTLPYDPGKPGQFSAPPTFEEEMAAMEDGNQMRRDGMAAQAMAEDDHMARQKELYGEASEYRAETAETQQAMHEASVAAAQEAEANIAQQRAEMTRMDRGKIWKDTDYAGKFVGLMSAGIAGWLNPTGKNSVIEQMMEMVDQSAREQQANMQLEQNQLMGAERAMGRMEDRMAADERAYLERRTLLAGNIADQFKMEAEKYGSMITKGKLLESAGAAEMEYQKGIVTIRQMDYQNQHQAEKTRADESFRRAEARRQAAQVAARLAFDERQAAAKAAEVKGEEFDPYEGRQFLGSFNGKRLYAGKGIKASDSKVNEFQTKLQAEQSVVSTLNALRILVGQKGKRNWTPDARTNVQSLVEEFNLAMRPVTGANFTPQEEKGLKKYIGDPNALLQSPEQGIQILERVIARAPSRIATHASVYDPEWYGERDQEIDLAGPSDPTIRTTAWEPFQSSGGGMGSSLAGVTFADAQEQAIGDYMGEVDAAINSFRMNSAEGRDDQANSAKSAAFTSAIELASRLGEWKVGSGNEALRNAALDKIREAEQIAGVEEGALFSPHALGAAVSAETDEEPDDGPFRVMPYAEITPVTWGK